MQKPAVERHVARRAGEPGEFCEADGVAGADHFRDVSLHCQLTVINVQTKVIKRFMEIKIMFVNGDKNDAN